MAFLCLWQIEALPTLASRGGWGVDENKTNDSKNRWISSPILFPFQGF
jgi:hypothetical protein